MKRAIIFILLFVIGICLFKPVKEGMVTSDYNNCLSKGFTKEFCVQTPFAGNVVGTCLCDDGNTGLLMPGFKGECICGDQSTFIYYDV
jgi:putative hemolysin